ncbi:MAG: penicillin-insensitive murein endopeptidase [Pseudobdellovibrionaceae bacterium]
MERKLIFLSILIFLLASCEQNGFQIPLASVKSVQNAPVETTYSPPTSTQRMVGTQKMVDGASQVSGFKLNIDAQKSTSTLQGTFTFQPENGPRIDVPIDVSGAISSEDYMAFMSAKNPDKMKALDLESGAKLTCLYTDCTESFIDIYIKYKGTIYHHQVEAKGNEIPPQKDQTQKDQEVKTPPTQETVKSEVSDSEVSTPEVPTTASSPKKSSPKEVSPKEVPAKEPPAKKDSANSPQDQDEDVQTESAKADKEEHDDIDEEAEAGPYVGEPERDIEVLFPTTSNSSNATKNLTPTKEDKDKDKTPDKESIKLNDKSPEETSGGWNIVKGIVKSLGQAITAPGKRNYVKGRLENAANILDYTKSNPNAGFHIIYPKDKTYFGTDDMLAVLISLGRYSLDKLNGYVLEVKDISAQKGGHLGGHSSHQMGLDADIAYYLKEKKIGLVNVVKSSRPVPGFMAEKQWEMFKTLVSQGNVDRIFIHPVLKKEMCKEASKTGDLNAEGNSGPTFETLRVLQPEVHHDDHFHLRLKCSTAQPRCKQMAPPKKVTGC